MNRREWFFILSASLLLIALLSYFSKSFLVAFIVLIASASIGGLCGFIFGLPRKADATESSSQSAQNAAGAISGNASSKSAEDIAVTINTSSWANQNLIAISDWLTKAIVAVALVRFDKMIEWLGGAGRNVSIAMGAVGYRSGRINDTSGAIGASIILAGFSIGFLSIYVLTRTSITKILFEYSDLVRGLTRKSDLAEKRSKEAYIQLEKNSAFLEAVRKSLNPAQLTYYSSLKSLYENPPESYENAISIISSYLEFQSGDDKEPLQARLHSLLVCAHSQKYAHHISIGETRGVNDILSEIISQINIAIRLDESEKDFLRSLWDPAAPGYSENEADLKALYDNAEARSRISPLLIARDI